MHEVQVSGLFELGQENMVRCSFKSWLLCLVCLPGVLWLLCDAMGLSAVYDFGIS